MFPSSILPSFLSPPSSSSSMLAALPQLDLSALFNAASASQPPPPQPVQASDSFLLSTLRALQFQLLMDQQRQQLAMAVQSLLEPILKEGMEEAKPETQQNPLERVEHVEGTEQGAQPQTIGSSCASNSGSSCRSSADCEPKVGKAKARKRPAQMEMRPEAVKEEDNSSTGFGKAEKRKGRKRRRRTEAETDSPVSGMFIKDFCDEEELRQASSQAELDDSAAFVHVTEASRRAIAAIPDVIGESRCALCKIRFEDVFRLAMHKCPRIRHEEYRCRECEKVFSCPANLASHRRWHRPRAEQQQQQKQRGKEQKMEEGGEQQLQADMPGPPQNGHGSEMAPSGTLLPGRLAGLAEAANALISLGLVK